MRLRLNWRVVGLTMLIIGIGGALGLYFYADKLIEQQLRPATIELLEKRFNSTVQLDRLTVSFIPTLQIRGEGLTLRHQGRTDIPPLITIRAFTISSSVRELWERHLDQVRVEGLEFMIPPRRRADMPKMTPRDDTGRDDDGPNVYIHELITEDSLLMIMSKRAGKGPRVFQIRKIRFEEFQFAKAVPFEAAITNPTPQGEIAVAGSFGPWESDEPSLTPIAGTFLFDADLGSIKGIGGQMHAKGEFSGPLEYIRTSGQTKTDGFHLSTGGAQFPLTVDYDAVVDATNGDTTLERVDGMLGTSKISARGEIVRVEGVKGRRITLDTTTSGGRLEDFIKLTTRIKRSPMTGIVNVKAKLDIPPGEPEVIERMDLQGTFDVGSARFTTPSIQDKVDDLARRGSGRPSDESIDDVASNLRGVFHLNDARMAVKSLTFRVQGASVRLAGVYDVRREVMDFRGELRLQAKVSQTQTGWKRFVLKVFDPMLDGKGAGTVLPISVTGTAENPKFGADIKKAILH